MTTGLCPSIFWELTPWQFRCCISGFEQREQWHHDSAAWTMWHGALLGRVKKMPPLTDFLSTAKKRVKGIDEAAILTRLKAYQQQVDRAKSSKTISRPDGQHIEL